MEQNTAKMGQMSLPYVVGRQVGHEILKNFDAIDLNLQFDSQRETLGDTKFSNS